MYTRASSRGGEIFDFFSGDTSIRSARIRGDEDQGVGYSPFSIKNYFTF